MVVETRVIPVADPDQAAVNNLKVCRDTAVVPCLSCPGHRFGIDKFTCQDDDRTVSIRVIKSGNIARPEMAQAAHHDKRDEPDNHDNGQADCAGIQPDIGFTAVEPVPE